MDKKEGREATRLAASDEGMVLDVEGGEGPVATEQNLRLDPFLLCIRPTL